MTDDPRDDASPEPDDPGANTEMFRAFAEREDPQPAASGGTSFRVATLVVGLLVFAGIVWLLLR